MQFSLEFSKPRCYVKISFASYRTKRLWLGCLLVPMCLNSLRTAVSSGDDSAYEGEGIVGYLPKATSFMPEADELSGTEDMHDMDLDARAMDQDGQERAHCMTLASSIV